MSMHRHIVAFRPPDETYRRMKAVYDACEEAGVRAPVEVCQFFEHRAPDPAGVTIDLYDSPAVSAWHAESEDGLQVDLSQLDKTLTILRFVDSW